MARSRSRSYDSSSDDDDDTTTNTTNTTTDTRTTENASSGMILTFCQIFMFLLVSNQFLMISDLDSFFELYAME